MAPSSAFSSFFILKLNFIIFFLLFAIPSSHVILADARCYNSIFSFGDSLADTGNRLYSLGDQPSAIAHFPYGETYFHRPTGRYCNGRLVVDFIAEALGLPLLPPYLGHGSHDFRQGVNFAVGGATALNASFFRERQIQVATNFSLGVQLDWFKQLLSSLCDPSSNDCCEFLSKSLFLVGEIGGNDYNHPFFDRRSLAEIQTFVPKVIDAISSAISILIDQGAVTLMVPGNLPIGCSSIYLTKFESPNKEDYNADTGCLKWLNKFSKYHNKLLRKELDRLRALHPHTKIMYVDYYNAAMQFYRSPNQLGFMRGALTACCGGGGPYNYNTSATCGNVGSDLCNDPSLYVGWDGIHLTEAAYRVIATALLQDHKIVNNIGSCTSLSQPQAGGDEGFTHTV